MVVRRNTSLFFSHHTVWLPKWWVALLITIIAVSLLWIGLKNMSSYLAVSEPKHGNYLVVDGWLNKNNLKQALDIFRHPDNRYTYLITIGGPDILNQNIEALTYAEQSAKFFRSNGVDEKKIIIISTPHSAQDRTYLSAVKLREWFYKEEKQNSVIDVFTGAVHARRTLFLYNLAFRSKINIGVYAAEPVNFSLKTWWKTSQGAKTTVTEFLAYLWTILFFSPGEYGSHQERWGVEKSAR